MSIVTRGAEVPAVLRPVVAMYRRATYDIPGGDGCCTCGGPTYNWVYWGATAFGSVDEYPDRSLSDWAQCDSCHEADPMAELPSRRLSDAERAEYWRDFLSGRFW